MMPVRRAPGINLTPVGERTTARNTIDSELLNSHRFNPIMLFEGTSEHFNYYVFCYPDTEFYIAQNFPCNKKYTFQLILRI